jgi:hypothetical protein
MSHVRAGPPEEQLQLPPEEILVQPELTFRTGLIGDKCVLQVTCTAIVDPEFMRTLAEQFANTAAKAGSAIVVPGRPSIVPRIG